MTLLVFCFAGSQYKNKYNFSNLLHHKEDFGKDAIWIFAATAHFKNECDAVGGTVKSSAHRAALTGTTILSATQLFEFLQQEMSTDTREFLFADKKDLDAVRDKLKPRYDCLQTVPGIRRFHSVEASGDKLKFRVLSADEEYFEHDLKPKRKKTSTPYTVGSFIAMKTSESFALGRISAIEESDNTITVDLLRRKGRKNNFVWPQVTQRIQTAPEDVFFKVSDPVFAGRSQRYLKLEDKDYEKIINLVD